MADGPHAVSCSHFHTSRTIEVVIAVQLNMARPRVATEEVSSRCVV